MFKMTSINALTALSALTTALVLPISASAVPFTIDNIETKGFVCDSAAPPSGVGALNCPAGTTPDTIEWRQGDADVSSLVLTSLTPVTGINPGDPAVRINQLTHNNDVIPSAFSFSIDIANTIQVTDENGGAIVLTDTNAITISFTETQNQDPCTFDNPAGSICDDFFDFDAGGLAPVAFTAGGLNYLLIFGLEPGDGAVLVGNRVYTAENQSSHLFVTAQIIAQPTQIPEPISLALLGLGLLGIGFTLRHRKM